MHDNAIINIWYNSRMDRMDGKNDSVLLRERAMFVTCMTGMNDTNYRNDIQAMSRDTMRWSR